MHIINERSQSEKSIYYIVPTMRRTRNGRTVVAVKTPVVVRGCKGGGMNRQKTKYFSGSEIILYSTVVIDTGNYTFVKNT